MERISKLGLRGLALSLALLFPGASAWATPTVSIDLDPMTAGIQSTRTVDPGNTFTIDVVYTGDGGTAFDTFAFAADFNDMGPVLGLVAPMAMFAPGDLAAGSIAATCPIPPCVDTHTFLGVAPGGFLVPAGVVPGVPFLPTAGFAATSDGVGLLSFVLPFTGAPIPLGTTMDLFSVTFDALAPGTSTVLPSPGTLGGLFFLGGGPLPISVASGTVTVTPEPGTLLLLGSGLAGLVAWRMRKPTSA